MKNKEEFKYNTILGLVTLCQINLDINTTPHPTTFETCINQLEIALKLLKLGIDPREEIAIEKLI